MKDKVCGKLTVKLRHFLMALGIDVVVPLLSIAIPEPDLVLYGQVRNDYGGATVRLTQGAMQWTVRSTDNVQRVVSATNLTNINDQFSYVIFLPAGSDVPGLPADVPTNVVKLTPSGSLYDRSEILIDGVAATLISPTATVSYAKSDRGKVQRIDLLVSIQFPDTDGDDLPDYWEQQYFSNPTSTNNATGDFDSDGVSNADEYAAGTNPLDPNSLLKFVTQTRLTNGTHRVQWSSVSNRTYRVSRAPSLFSGYTPIATNITSTPTTNTIIDSSATNSPQSFYRIELE